MHYEENKKTWNGLAEAYKEKFNTLSLYHHSYDLFCSYVNNTHAAILDIGCGPATVSSYLYSKNKGYVIHGIDVAPNMVALAQSTVPTGFFQVLDSRNLDQISQKYEGVICGFCLPYIAPQDCPKLLQDVYHLLKDSGIFYLSFVEGNATLPEEQTSPFGQKLFFHYHKLEEIGRAHV